MSRILTIFCFRVNIELWKTDSPALQVPEAILIQTLEKGTEGLVMRRKEEWHLWQNSKEILIAETFYN